MKQSAWMEPVHLMLLMLLHLHHRVLRPPVEHHSSSSPYQQRHLRHSVYHPHRRSYSPSLQLPLQMV